MLSTNAIVGAGRCDCVGPLCAHEQRDEELVLDPDLSDIDDVGSKNHGKFAKSPSIVQLIGRGLQKTDTLDVALIERPNVLPTLIER